MKQSLAEPLALYAALIRQYHGTLDLVSPRALDQLERLIETAVRYGQLIADLSPAPQHIVDVGSGAGLPGIPVALVNPATRVTLVERRRRRTAFLRTAAARLGLVNVSVAGGDVRELDAPCADVVMAQAVAELAHIYRLTAHLHGESVWLVSRKGPAWREELAAAEKLAGGAALEVREEGLSRHGSLLAILLSGGAACPPLA